MNDNLHALYDELIRKHNDQPHRFIIPSFPSEPVQAYNPVCGDKFTIYISKEKNPLQKLTFQGIGCAISKASTSIMLHLIEGKSISEARAIGKVFIRYLQGEAVAVPDELHAFSGITKFPERFDCAALPWLALDAFYEAHTPK
ncbi:MAG TPA: SUF system NifU family Fe-S cluster assembly protein [Cyclobacteriaceae bacterium]|nr:SUF system NifU family Fe-S cluster assembly protein [Cyclobacteriaceae bacterium]